MFTKAQRGSSTKKEVNLTEGPFLKKIIVYVIPLIFTGLLQCLYNAADLVIVGRFRGSDALAAVGTTGALTNLVVGLFMGLSVGAGVVVAHHVGALEYKRVSRVVHTAVVMAASLGVIVGTVGFIFARTFLMWMDTPDTIIDAATLYLRIIFCGVPASLIYNYCASMVNSVGETKRPLIFLAISGAVNLLLNVVLVVGCGMGVDGVAIGTIASQYLSAILIIGYMMKTDSCIKFSFKKLCFDLVCVKKMLVIGVPSGIQSVLFSLSNVLIQSSVNSFGEFVMAGNAAAANIEGFCYVAMNAVYRAALTFTGQNYGAKKYKNIKTIALQTVGCATVIGLFVAVVSLLFKDFLLGLYISGEGLTPEAFETTFNAGLKRFYYILPLYFMCGIMEALCGVMRGMGKSTATMIFSLVGACGLRIFWIQVVFKYLIPTIEGVYISYPISWFLVISLNAIYVFYFYRRLMRDAHKEVFFDKIRTHRYNKDPNMKIK